VPLAEHDNMVKDLPRRIEREALDQAPQYVIVVTIQFKSWAHSRHPSGPTHPGPRTRGNRHVNGCAVIVTAIAGNREYHRSRHQSDCREASPPPPPPLIGAASKCASGEPGSSENKGNCKND